MPDKLVVDASALAAVFFHEPEADDMEKRLKGRIWLAPSLIDYEIISIARKKIIKYPNLSENIREAVSLFLATKFLRIKVSMQPVLELSLAKKLTTYDASYLWLAQEYNCDLLTLDSQLNKAKSS